MSTCPYPVSQIDKYRYRGVEHDWARDIDSYFKYKMLDIGVFVERIFFDVSYCQGSGACFEGYILDWGKYLLHLGYDSPILTEAALYWRLDWKHGGRYCHEHSVTYDEEIWANINPYNEEEDTLKFDMWANVMNTFDLYRLSNDIKEDLRGHMKELHKILVAEYEYLTSDESVSDWMQANDIESELTNLEN
jgi:hypothetical protein